MSNWYRNFQNLIENIVPYDHSQSLQGEVGGAHRDGMTLAQAKEYLDNHPDGMLKHDGFETDAFVGITKFGVYVFYNPINDRIEHWDWTKDVADLAKYYEEDSTYDIMNDWGYIPSDEMMYTKGGMEFWDRIRNGLEIPE
jgi:hypothetical protein